MKRVIAEKLSGKLGAAIRTDEFGDTIELMRNGNTWNGQPITPELAEMLVEVLTAYIETEKS